MCVETNAYSNEQSGGVSKSIENYAVLDVLLKNMPLLKGIIAHGKVAHQALDNLDVPSGILTRKLRHFRGESYDAIDRVCEEILAA